MLKYWLRLVTLPHDRLVSQCYWALQNKPNFHDSSGFSHIWHDQKSLHQHCSRSISLMTTSILKSLESQFLQNANSEICDQNKLHLYKSIAHSLEPAPYLLKLKSRNERSLLSKLRLGTLKLEIETGRHEKIKVESTKRFCKLCNSNQIGNECHFLFECPALVTSREPLLENITKFHCNLPYRTSEEKVKYLFFNNHLDNPSLIEASKLLSELSKTRNALLASS